MGEAGDEIGEVEGSYQGKRDVIPCADFAGDGGDGEE